jgi:hypothetical protein
LPAPRPYRAIMLIPAVASLAAKPAITPARSFPWMRKQLFFPAI